MQLLSVSDLTTTQVSFKVWLVGRNRLTGPTVPQPEKDDYNDEKEDSNNHRNDNSDNWNRLLI
jgi:hypothetical protein